VVRVFPFSHQNSIFGNCLADCSVLSSKGPPRACPVGERVSSAKTRMPTGLRLSPAPPPSAGAAGLGRDGCSVDRKVVQNHRSTGINPP